MDLRVECRFPTDIEAECRTAGRAWTARLHNISVGGCMLGCTEGLPTGTLLRLRIKGMPAIDGAIAWHHRAHAGVRFREPLPAAMLDQLGLAAVAAIPVQLATAG